MKLNVFLLFICSLVISSSLNAVNLTNNTSWRHIKEIEDDEHPDEILGEAHILLDVSKELLSLVVKYFDTDNNLIDVKIIKNIPIIMYKRANNSYSINNEVGFYYEKDSKKLLMNFNDEDIVFEQIN